MNQDELKKEVAKVAVDYITDDSIVGVGTGSTVNFFIEELAKIKHRIEGAVSSSEATETLLKKHNIPVYELNSVMELPIYIDGADEATEHRHLIKGGGGALTREKIVRAVSRKFICIMDESKLVGTLGAFPLPVEVIPMARSYVSRELAKLGGQPKLREGFISDNGNEIVDVHNLKILDPIELETKINQIPGVVTNGLFALNPATELVIGTKSGIKTIN